MTGGISSIKILRPYIDTYEVPEFIKTDRFLRFEEEFLRVKNLHGT